MRLHVVVPRASELEDLREEVYKLKDLVSPLEIIYDEPDTFFEIPKPKGDINVYFLAPKRGEECLYVPVVDRLMEMGFKIFYTPFHEAPSSIEDFIDYLRKLMGVKE